MLLALLVVLLVATATTKLQVLEQCVEQQHDEEADDGAENHRAPLLLVEGAFWQHLVHDGQDYRVQVLLHDPKNPLEQRHAGLVHLAACGATATGRQGGYLAGRSFAARASMRKQLAEGT